MTTKHLRKKIDFFDFPHEDLEEQALEQEEVQESPSEQQDEKTAAQEQIRSLFTEELKHVVWQQAQKSWKEQLPSTVAALENQTPSLPKNQESTLTEASIDPELFQWFQGKIKDEVHQTEEKDEDIKEKVSNNTSSFWMRSIEKVKEKQRSFIKNIHQLQQDLEHFFMSPHAFQQAEGMLAKGLHHETSLLATFAHPDEHISTLQQDGQHCKLCLHQNYRFVASLPTSGYLLILELADQQEDDPLDPPLCIFPDPTQPFAPLSAGLHYLFNYQFDEVGSARFLLLFGDSSFASLLSPLLLASKDSEQEWTIHLDTLAQWLEDPALSLQSFLLHCLILEES